MISFWETLKKYWQVVAGVAIAVLGMLALRRRKDPTEILENQREAHQKELEAIKKSEQILENKSKEAEYIYNRAIKEIEKNHEEKQQALTENMKKQVKRIVEENKENPSEITNRISELTGYTVYVEKE